MTAEARMLARPRAVRDRGKMTADGWQPENVAWIDVLAPRTAEGYRAEVNPMQVDPAVLTASGHPPTHRAAAIIGRLRDMPIGKRAPNGGPWRLTNLRQFCLTCAENRAEVRRCVCIECPIWPYRMGHNPHHPRRGIMPAIWLGKPPAGIVSTGELVSEGTGVADGPVRSSAAPLRGNGGAP